MNKGEWIQSYELMPAPMSTAGEYLVEMAEYAEILGVGIESDGTIVVIARRRIGSNLTKRTMLVLHDGGTIGYQYTRYIGSVNDPRFEGSAAWRHVFEVTRPNDDEEPVKKDGKILLAATPGC